MKCFEGGGGVVLLCILRGLFFIKGIFLLIFFSLCGGGLLICV